MTPAEPPSNTPCACGSGRLRSACCGPLLDGTARARTAESLMCARYTAFVEARIDFVTATLHEKARADHDEAAARRWAEQSEWLGLEIVEVQSGAETDERGSVEFKARYRLKGETVEHHERALFVRQAGEWVFLDSELPKAETYVRTAPAVGRNEACPCGSGKKAKRCCGVSR